MSASGVLSASLKRSKIPRQLWPLSSQYVSNFRPMAISTMIIRQSSNGFQAWECGGAPHSYQVSPLAFGWEPIIGHSKIPGILLLCLTGCERNPSLVGVPILLFVSILPALPFRSCRNRVLIYHIIYCSSWTQVKPTDLDDRFTCLSVCPFHFLPVFNSELKPKMPPQPPNTDRPVHR